MGRSMRLRERGIRRVAISVGVHAAYPASDSAEASLSVCDGDVRRMHHSVTVNPSTWLISIPVRRKTIAFATSKRVDVAGNPQPLQAVGVDLPPLPAIAAMKLRVARKLKPPEIRRFRNAAKSARYSELSPCLEVSQLSVRHPCDSWR
jgi:hypothetical protein